MRACQQKDDGTATLTPGPARRDDGGLWHEKSRSTTRRSATAPRARACPSRWRTRSASPSGSTSSASTTSRAAGPAPIPRTCASSSACRTSTLKHAKLAAFGMTRRAGGVGRRRTPTSRPSSRRAPPVVTIVGKSWDFHVTEALDTTLDENLAMIARLGRLPPQALRGGDLRRRALLRRLQAQPRVRARARCRRPEAAGAHCLVLCDTNGGTLPHELVEIVREVKRAVKRTPLGIHVHNDAECAVANSLAAVARGRRARCRGRSTASASAAATPTSCSIIPNLDAQDGARVHPAAEPARAARRLALRLRAGQPQAVVVAALRRRLRLRPQGRHARLRGARSIPRPTSTSIPRRSATTGACSSPSWPGKSNILWKARGVRDRPRQEHPGLPPHPRAAQGAGGRGLPVRGRGGVVRAPDGAGARPPPAVLRAARAIA